MKRKQLSGMRFGNWTVLDFDVASRSWNVLCDCGNLGKVKSNTLLSGKSTRCKKCRDSIVSEKNKKHGMSKSRIYHIWRSMKQRCTDPNVEKYPRYGGRGILICENWKNSFESFYEWSLSNGYRENLTIDRINNDGNYCPENCRWVGLDVQANNRGNNRVIEVNGESKNLREWEETSGIKRETIAYRLNSGWKPEEAVTVPAMVGRNQVYGHRS